jgi:hypothetical protein
VTVTANVYYGWTVDGDGGDDGKGGDKRDALICTNRYEMTKDSSCVRFLLLKLKKRYMSLVGEIDMICISFSGGHRGFLMPWLPFVSSNDRSASGFRSFYRHLLLTAFRFRDS